MILSVQRFKRTQRFEKNTANTSSCHRYDGFGNGESVSYRVLFAGSFVFTHYLGIFFILVHACNRRNFVFSSLQAAWHWSCHFVTTEREWAGEGGGFGWGWGGRGQDAALNRIRTQNLSIRVQCFNHSVIQPVTFVMLFLQWDKFPR